MAYLSRAWFLSAAVDAYLILQASNVEADSRVGLLFVDFADGWILQATGSAEIIWDDNRVARHEGAERLVEITVDRTIELPNGNPLRRSLEKRSPFNP